MTKKILKVFIFFLLAAFVLINFYSFQVFQPLFFSLINTQRKSDAVLFLKKIKKHKEFNQQLVYFKNLYGPEIEKDVFEEEIKRKREIKKLETLLQKNEKARDVLLKLAILYFEDENFKKAKEYYQKAKKIDPQIKIEELEKFQ